MHLRNPLARAVPTALLALTALLTVLLIVLTLLTQVAPARASAAPPAPVAPLAASTVAAGPVAATADTAPDGSTDGTDENGYADNPFLPEDRTLGECSSSLPKPGCGSSAHGGWRQGIVFAVLMLGMAFIGWRIFRAVRRADRRVPG